MDDALPEKEFELACLLQRAAKLSAQIEQEKRAPGVAPHFSRIEGAAYAVGQRLSRAIVDESAEARDGDAREHAECPDCGRGSPVESKKRTILSVVGPVEIAEPIAHCRSCRRSFFPSA